jgi:hypothetical protein
MNPKQGAEKMKKLLLVATLVLLVIISFWRGWIKVRVHPNPYPTVEMLKVGEGKLPNGQPFDIVTFNSHRYVVTYNTRGVSNITHDASCPCQK